jgi:hypothetical protein
VLLKVERGILIQDRPSIGATFSMLDITVSLVIKVRMTFFQNNDSLLGVHIWNDQISNKLLLKEFMIKEVPYLQKINNVYWVDLVLSSSFS